MDIGDVVPIATVREKTRSNGLPIDMAGIRHHIERILASAASEDASPANSENDTAATDSLDEVLTPWIDVVRPRIPTDVTNVTSPANLGKGTTGSNTEAGGYDRTKEVVVTNPPEKADGHGSRPVSLVRSGL